MDKIKFEDVFKSYNGRNGCMCGCLGDYKLPSHTSIDEANRQIGYDGYTDEDVSDRSVKIAVNKVNKLIELYGDLDTESQREKGLWVCTESGKIRWAGAHLNGRNTTVYLK